MRTTFRTVTSTDQATAGGVRMAPTTLRKITIAGVGASLCAGAVVGSALGVTGASAVAPSIASGASLAAVAAVTPRPRARQVSKRVIGRSVEGRKIVAQLYGSPTATKVGVVIGSMHGTERAGARIVKKLRKKGAPKGTAMWTITTLNPDGHRKKQRGNANGVDLNRNGSDLWKGRARAPAFYPGPGALSEPETRAYVSFLSEIDPDVVLIYHQAGNGVDSYQQKNRGLTTGLAKRMKLPVKSFNCDGECTGTLTGWFNKNEAGTALTVELTRRVAKKQVKRGAQAARWAVRYVPDVNLD
jgi:protein MpaA